MNKYLLSICIPTYNRANYLRECLESLVGQIELRSDDVEIIVSDNCSTDLTPELVKRFQDRYSFIRFFRNNENLGGRRNIWLATTYSKAEYVWLLGDDDMVIPGGVERVVQRLLARRLDELALLFLNDLRFSQNGKSLVMSGPNHLPTTFFQHGLRIIEHFPLQALAHISRLVLRRQDWTRSSYNAYDVTWGCPQLGALVEMLRCSPAEYLETPVIFSRSSDSSWFYERGPTMWCYEFPWIYMQVGSSGLGKTFARRKIRGFWRNTVKQFIKMKIFSDYYKPNLGRLRIYHGDQWYYYAFMLPLTLLFRSNSIARGTLGLAKTLRPSLHIPKGNLHREA